MSTRRFSRKDSKGITRRSLINISEPICAMRYFCAPVMMEHFRSVDTFINEASANLTVAGQDYKSPPPATPYVGVVVDLEERDVLNRLREMGGFWSPGDRLWYAPELYVRRVGLHKRIVKRAGHSD